VKVSLNWLRELVDLDGLDGAEVARALTRAGVEVEARTRFGDFAGVVVAEVRGKRPHPGAAKLTLVDVWDGATVTQVVCGAPNVPEAGALVLWARPGARLPDGTVLAPKEVRGVVSPGMLCAEDELGLGESHEGIIVLQKSDGLSAGEDAAAALGLPDEIFELSLTPNRPDCLGHLGVAREVGALTGRSLKPRPRRATAERQRVDGAASPDGRVVIEDPAGCPRYTALVLDGVTIAPSPIRVRLRLQALGVRAISNVVDVTNLVMLETGQPIHAFDLDRLAGGRIIVRSAKAGERQKTLDDVERVHAVGDVLICDGNSVPCGIGGVMGGGDSEVRPETKRLLVEAAAFDPTRVRRTAKRLGLHTEAAHRFERGVDPNAPPDASLRCAALVEELAGGRVAGPLVDVVARPEVLAPRTIRLRPERTQALLVGFDRIALDGKAIEPTLGGALAPEAQRRALEALGLSVRGADGSALEVTVPTFRPDLTREVDLVEEIARLVGYDPIPSTLPPLVAAPRPPEARTRLTEAIRRALVGVGLDETLTYAFVAPQAIAALGLADGDRRSRPRALANPLREELSVLRTALLPGLVGALGRNLSRGVTDVRLFELATVFLPRDGGEAPQAPEERTHVAGVLAGTRDGWLRPEGAPPVDFYDMKGVVEELAAAVGWSLRFEPAREPYLHPGLQATIVVDGERRGVVGELHPAYRERSGIETVAFAFELELAGLAARPTTKTEPLPRFPAAMRDLSFFVDAAVPADAVRATLVAAGEPLLTDVRVVEDYREAGRVPDGKKGMLWSFTFRSPERTLTDAEVDAAHARLRDRLVSALGIAPR
jgi:phenylalanyl-tRNA synthetase beta chain